MSKKGRFIIDILLLFSILKLSLKVNGDANDIKRVPKKISICSELCSLLEKPCYLLSSTRDVVLRKFNLPCNIYHCYGLDLEINRRISHASILLLIIGDIATNAGPYKHSNREDQIVKCLALNAPV